MLSKRNLLKTCLQFTYPSVFLHTLQPFLLWEKVKLADLDLSCLKKADHIRAQKDKGLPTLT